MLIAESKSEYSLKVLSSYSWVKLIYIFSLSLSYWSYSVDFISPTITENTKQTEIKVNITATPCSVFINLQNKL